jgi:uncharacterized protein
MIKAIRKFSAVLALFMVLGVQPACSADAIQQDVLTIETQNNGPIVFHIEMVTSGSEMEKGLMNRTELAEDSGMLFVWPDVEQRAFWMKDTLIPLDMIFIAEDGTIHHIHHMAKPLDLTKITSERPSKAVLEINGGLSDILGIVEGDRIIHPAFRNQLAQ